MTQETINRFENTLSRISFQFMAQFKTDDLTTLAQLMESGAAKSVIDRTFPLEETAVAMTMQGSKRISGKVVITNNSEEQKSHGKSQ